MSKAAASASPKDLPTDNKVKDEDKPAKAVTKDVVHEPTKPAEEEPTESKESSTEVPDEELEVRRINIDDTGSLDSEFR